MDDNDDIGSNGRPEVSGISAVNISDPLPNGDDSAFVDENEEQTTVNENSVQHVTVDVSQADLVANNVPVYVATSQGILSAEQLKTTHIVIHDQSMTVSNGPPNSSLVQSPLNSPGLPPPTPATPLSREKGFKYQWDDSAFLATLPIRCKNTSGELHKDKFGSGGRGKCIKTDNDPNWYTPTEFESVCGRGSSKDWKRSIRYGGRILQCLIEDGILQPHATSCTCAACCDDITVTGPVRLFQPYKRRKRESSSTSGLGTPIKKARQPKIPSPLVKDATSVMAVKLPTNQGNQQQAHPIQIASSETGEILQILATDSSGNILATAGGEYQDTQVVVTAGGSSTATSPAKTNGITIQTNTSNISVSPDVAEQKHWWQLEEMANNLISMAQQLKTQIEDAKQQSMELRETSINQLKAQFEREKQEAISAMRIEGQMNLSRTVIEERTQKEIALQNAFAQARAEMNESVSDVADKVTYSVTWAPPTSHRDIGTIIDGEDSDQEKEKE
ncbi:unnamed protein product [Owenia fusiformis]|uniref:Uncharacterized protein n=1 Tax=Owenia fusiformis TaxID=6347 RepID=A0A8J1XJ76_OWEFU|nr:unnamed protein product [Owenia fusiformis]